jgi:glycosyltransferase involved in cell wall biosynthesis
MYHADLVGGLVARWASVRSIVWGIRNSNLDNKSSFSVRVVAQLCAGLSHWLPAAIVCCSKQAARVHQDIGYCKEKFTVIPNGYDLARFAPDNTARAQLRYEWGIAADEILMGLVARWDPQKDHANLLRALSQLKAKHISVRCVLVGTGMDADNTILNELIRDYQLNDAVILAGSRDDIPTVMNALDLHVLPSAYGEAFPNVVAEAMACGTPCVVTNVGDAALIVGDTGWVVPPSDADALASGIGLALTILKSKGRATLGETCRQRIESNFGLGRMVAAYMTTWKNIEKIRGGYCGNN